MDTRLCYLFYNSWLKNIEEIVTDNGYEQGISISFLFQEYFIHQKKIQSFEYIKQYIREQTDSGRTEIRRNGVNASTVERIFRVNEHTQQ